MNAVKNDVKRLVKIELAAANKKFRMFAGPHEGAGIIQEEVVEAAQEMNGLCRELRYVDRCLLQQSADLHERRIRPGCCPGRGSYPDGGDGPEV